MKSTGVEALFDQTCASGYDQMQSRLAPLRDVLHLLTGVILSDLPAEARVLCVGAGTGTELIALAERFPGWHFTAVEPSLPMVDACRRKLEASGLAARCTLHGGYLDSLPASAPFDAATALLVSQFVLDPAARRGFFRGIGERLRPGGWLVSADLAADTGAPAYKSLLDVWWRVMRNADVSPDDVERMRQAYDRDVAVLPPGAVGELIASGGFETPVPFLQTGLIHAWYARWPGACT